jgi:hypothetical protein
LERAGGSFPGHTSTLIQLLFQLLAPQPEFLLGPKPIFLRSSNRRPAIQPILVRQPRNLFSFWAVARYGLHLRRFDNNLLRLIPG